jgi:hypothetical protein
VTRPGGGRRAIPLIVGAVTARMHATMPAAIAPTTLAVRLLAAMLAAGPSTAAEPGQAQPALADFGLRPAQLTRLAQAGIPFIDCHVHLRGGMTLAKALARQSATGIRLGVLDNLGAGWPLETDDHLRAFLDANSGRGLYVGVQVNDRGWHKRHDPRLLARLDYVLGDTMIMPMPDDAGPPVKLWQPAGYAIDDPQAWMERYLRHNLQVLAEPIDILANPTYLPPPVADLYDELWTEARMRAVIRAAIDNRVALEINAGSGYPRARFIRLARQMGAKFSFGTNNFDDKPLDMARCLAAIAHFGLGPADLYTPRRR